MVKVTIPPKFGLTPRIHFHRNANLRDDPDIPEFRKAIEFDRATPREYLHRWILSNQIFNDDVCLAAVIRWREEHISFCITQPHYNGDPATEREIEQYFLEASWTSIPDPSAQHQLFFNFAFNVLAIDALPRNCYLNDAGLQPFDVILCEPDEELASFLNIYPGT